METSYKKQYKVLEVTKNFLLVQDFVTKETYKVPKDNCYKVKRLNNAELIERYLKSFPKASTEQVLKETGLTNAIYVNKLRKKLAIS